MKATAVYVVSLMKKKRVGPASATGERPGLWDDGQCHTESYWTKGPTTSRVLPSFSTGGGTFG